MTSINTLPFIVTERIFCYCTPTKSKSDIFEWKKQLVLLSVCQQWRAVGLPIVYQYVFFQAVSNAPETHTINPARMHIDGLDQKVVASNIGLAGQIGAARYAKRFQIMVREFFHLNWLFSIIILAHRDYPELWPRIRLLDLHSFIKTDNLSELDELLIGDSSADDINERLLLIAQLVKLAMPNVNNVSFSGSTNSDFIKPLTDNLSVKYSPQLTHFFGTSLTTSYSSMTFTDNLTHLELVLDNTAKHVLPKVCAQRLEYLRLTDINQNFTWECFQSENKASDIVFSSLKTLKLDFYLDSLFSKPDEFTGNWRYQLNKEPLKVHFPKLEFVNIHSPSIESDISLFDVFPSKLKKLEYTTNICDLRNYQNCTIKSVDDLSYHMSLEEGLDEGFYEETNYFFNHVEIGRKSLLRIGNYIPLEIERIQWGNLKDLHIRTIDIASFLHLVEKLDNITCLEVLELDCADFDYSESPHSWNTRNSKLTDCVVVRHKSSNDMVEFVNALLFTIKAVPSIKKFGLNRQFKPLLVEAIEKTDALAYPHLHDLYISSNFNRKLFNTNMVIS